MKTINIILLLLLPVLGFSQIQKGSSYLSGDYSLILGKNNSFSILPGYGFLVKDNLALGVNGGYSYSKRVGGNINIGSGGLFIERFFPLSDQFSFSLKGEVTIGWQNTLPQKNTSYSIGVIPKIYFFPIEKIAITGSVGYLQLAYSNRDDLTLSSAGGNIQLGIAVFFNRD